MKTILGVVLMFSAVSFSQVQSGIINYTAEMNLNLKSARRYGFFKKKALCIIRLHTVFQCKYFHLF
jgi:hypothetical protein